jgi:hypothetical protein
MRDVIDAMPIVRAIRSLGRDRMGLSLLVAIAFYAAVSLMTPWSPPVQRKLMELHHLRPRSMLQWVLLQPAPKMYGMSHQAWIGAQPIFERPGGERIFSARAFQVNHYPARRARFDGSRGEIFGQHGRPQYVYLRTRYRGTRLGTGYAVQAADDQLLLRPLEAAP